MKYKKTISEERKASGPGLVIGDILYSSWGYEQTNVNFYQVIDVRNKMVILKEICGKQVESKGYARDAGLCEPVKDRFAKGEKEYRCIARNGSCKVNGYYASKWDGKPIYWSSYY